MSNSTLPREIWKPIPGYEGWYEVSSLGRVRSLDRTIVDLDGRRTRRMRGKILSPTYVRKHLSVTLYPREVDHSGRGEQRYVHRLVLLAFVGPGAPGEEVRHINGDPEDNRLDNLRWGTKSENALDTVKHGDHHNARKTHCPRGHLLGGPNQVPSKRGRDCLACNRARSWIRNRGGDLQAVSDRYYASILRDAPHR